MRNRLEVNHEHICGEAAVSLATKIVTSIVILGVSISISATVAYKLYKDFQPVDIPNYVSFAQNGEIGNYYTTSSNSITNGKAEKIQVLKLDLTQENTDLSFLDAFDNLGHLELVVDNESWEYINSIPKLDNLASLRLLNNGLTTQTVLEFDNLQFLQKFPGLKSLELDVGSTIIPSGAIEQFCPNLETITIKNWRNDNILTDLNYFPNLKEVKISNSYSHSISCGFSKNDYNKLINKGVNVSVIPSDTSIENCWEEHEKYFDDLNLTNCGTPKEVVDRVLIGMIKEVIPYSDSAHAARTLRALTHMAGITSKYIQGPEKQCCLIDIYGTGSYYEFNPEIILKNKDIINSITQEQIPGYMQEVDTDSYYINFVNNNTEKSITK